MRLITSFALTLLFIVALVGCSLSPPGRAKSRSMQAAAATAESPAYEATQQAAAQSPALAASYQAYRLTPAAFDAGQTLKAMEGVIARARNGSPLLRPPALAADFTRSAPEDKRPVMRC